MRFSLILLLLGLIAFPIHAQESDKKDDKEETPENVSDETNRKRRWQASLPGGKFAVKLDAITSISQSEYLLDGNLIVTEVTIDTTGNALARFYHIEPVNLSNNETLSRISSRAKQLAKRGTQLTGTDKLTLMAQKNYPTTTHAHTVEFRLETKAELNALYSSVYTAWDSGKGRDLEVTDEDKEEDSKK